MHYSKMLGKKLPASVALKFMNLVLNLSPTNLVRILDLLGPVARNEWQERGFTRIREMILENHGCVGAAQRISRQLNNKIKRRIFENFVIKGMLEGYDKRYAFLRNMASALRLCWPSAPLPGVTWTAMDATLPAMMKPLSSPMRR